MTDTEDGTVNYRTANLPGLGQIQIPDGVTDDEVLAQVLGEQVIGSKDSAATPAKKTKKKP